MKRFVLILITGALIAQASFSQAVSDKAVIPVSVTLNSVLRLTIESGGNIDFVFSNLEQYQEGITNSTQYTTTFSVSASTDYNVTMWAEESNLQGNNTTTTAGGSINTFSLDNIGYTINDPSGSNPSELNGGNTPPVALNETSTTEIVAYDGTNHNAGPADANTFEIQWECGTGGGNMNGTAILNQNVAADRYSVNVYLSLAPN